MMEIGYEKSYDFLTPGEIRLKNTPPPKRERLRNANNSVEIRFGDETLTEKDVLEIRMRLLMDILNVLNETPPSRSRKHVAGSPPSPPVLRNPQAPVSPVCGSVTQQSQTPRNAAARGNDPGLLVLPTVVSPSAGLGSAARQFPMSPSGGSSIQRKSPRNANGAGESGREQRQQPPSPGEQRRRRRPSFLHHSHKKQWQREELGAKAEVEKTHRSIAGRSRFSPSSSSAVTIQPGPGEEPVDKVLKQSGGRKTNATTLTTLTPMNPLDPARIRLMQMAFLAAQEALGLGGRSGGTSYNHNIYARKLCNITRKKLESE